MNMNEMGWVALLDTRENEYVPQRQIRRFSRPDNWFNNRAAAQALCDQKNTKYVRPIPLQLIPDATLKT